MNQGRRKHKIAVGSAFAAVVGAAAIRAYFAVIPRGASFQPWMFARVDGPELTSPDGRRVVRVYFNDAGAMHSGNHWTWVVEDSWWSGRKVVAQGYLGSNVAIGGAPVPLEWGPGDVARVKFLPRRYGGANVVGLL